MHFPIFYYVWIQFQIVFQFLIYSYCIKYSFSIRWAYACECSKVWCLRNYKTYANMIYWNVIATRTQETLLRFPGTQAEARSGKSKDLRSCWTALLIPLPTLSITTPTPQSQTYLTDLPFYLTLSTRESFFPP